MDATLMVEEDEEKFLKATCQDFSWIKSFQRKTGAFTCDVEGDSAKSGIVDESRKMSLGVQDSRKDSCVLAAPMKDDLRLSTFLGWDSLCSSNFDPIDQEDWEDRIVWHNSPTNILVEGCELSGPDSDTFADRERGLMSETRTLDQEIHSEPHDNDQAVSLNSCSFSLEPFCSNEYSESNGQFISQKSHPQLLRLESQLDNCNANSGGVEDSSTEAAPYSDATRRFSELTLQNRDIVEGSWLDDILWDPHHPVAKPKLIYDLQDEQMLFELKDMNDAKHLQLHAGAMIMAQALRPSSGDLVELHSHGIQPAGRFNISNDKFYSSRKSSQQLRSHSKKRSVHGLKVLHSVPVLKLQTMKAKLSK